MRFQSIFINLFLCSQTVGCKMFSRKFFTIPRKKMFSHNLSVVPAIQQTKEWRKNTGWYSTGKSNECEKYQKGVLQTLLSPHNLTKTDDRIHMEMFRIVEQRCPMNCADGYEYTENFDGLIKREYQVLSPIGKLYDRFYFNLKFVCNDGGAQTRTLRETYHFIRVQLESLLLLSTEQQGHLYFINILDGDTCCKSNKYFDYLLQKEKYRDVVKNVFVGDLFTFQHSSFIGKILKE